MSNDDQILEEFTSKEYEFGWTVDLEADEAPKGLNEDIIQNETLFSRLVIHVSVSLVTDRPARRREKS